MHVACMLCTLADAIVAGLDFEAALQDPNMVKLQASQQVCVVAGTS